MRFRAFPISDFRFLKNGFVERDAAERQVVECDAKAAGFTILNRPRERLCRTLEDSAAGF
jgi:hypothetical protein